MKSIKEIKELTKDLNVLYVEDEESIRTYMVDILNIFFDTVHVALDGVDGLEQFKDRNVDFVITDIQMPRMNGLSMVEEIRKIDSEVPIVITTAFSDQEYFIRSISLKVDKYLIKPIEQESAKEVFYDVAKMIDNRNKAKELEVRIMQDKINRMSEQIITQITDSYQSPCIVYTDDKVRYINDAFCSLFDPSELQDFLDHKISMDSLLDQRPDFMTSLDNFDEDDFSKNRVSISKQKGRKIYRIVRKEIEIDDSDKLSTIYFFNDITIEEYQKIKIKNYTYILEELLIDTKYRNVDRTVPENKLKEESEVKVEKEAVEDDNGLKLVIDENENDILRRSHVNKSSAQEYVSELDDETLKELQELNELERDFGESIILLQETSNIEGLRQMASQLENYAHEISLLFEFKDLSYAIRSLANLLLSVEESKLDEETIKKVVIFLSGIQSDLSDWNRLLFVEQSALDIHYLDSSLFSACLQIELILSSEISEMESEEDDLVLF